MNAESLRKVLDLEKRRAYADTAVFGGLDKFLANWASGAAASIANPRQLARFHRLFKVNYAAMSAAQRETWIKDVITFLDEKEPNKAPAEKAKTAAPPKQKAPPPARKSSPNSDIKSLDAPVTVVKGMGPALAAKFNKMGVKTVRDLLYYFPHRHLDYSRLKKISELNEGEEQTIVANVWQAQETRPGGRRSAEAIVGDETGNIRVVWFNQPYMVKTLATNARIIISGRVSLFKGQHVFVSPEWEPMDGQDFVHTARLVPVYPLTAGLRPRQVRRLMKQFIDAWAGQLTDFLPTTLRQRLDLLELPAAISQAHYPENEATKDKARIRLAFDEIGRAHV